MADKKTTRVLFEYSDGSSKYAVGDHAEEVMQWLSACQSMQCIHGGQYTGRKMIEVPAPTVTPAPHIDSDRLVGKTDWDEECQESGRLNRQ